MAAAIPVAEADAGGVRYPARFFIDHAKTSMNRFWGIPLFGVLARALLALPIYVGLAFVGIGLYLAVLVNWIPILFTGRQAGWIYGLTGLYLEWIWRATAYLGLLVGGYPLSSDFGARFELDRNQHFNQLWGIPLIGLWIRSLILIPHYVALFFLWFLAAVLVFVSWIPILVNGRQSDAIVTWVGGTLRWYMRVAAYLLFVASPYPPFSLE